MLYGSFLRELAGAIKESHGSPAKSRVRLIVDVGRWPGAASLDEKEFAISRRLSEGFRSVLPMTLMAMGEYQDPDGCYMPSILY